MSKIISSRTTDKIPFSIFFSCTIYLSLKLWSNHIITLFVQANNIFEQSFNIAIQAFVTCLCLSF